MKNRYRAALAALALVLISALAVLPVSAATVKSSYRVKVMSNNIAGGLLNLGNPSAFDDLETQIKTYNPDIVGLQEVCEPQVATFKERFPGWYVSFTKMRNNHFNCLYGSTDGTGTAQGQMLASRWPMSNEQITLLGGDDYNVIDKSDPKVFKLLCADVAIANYKKPVHACTTHLRAFNNPESEKARIVQTATIRSTLASRTSTSQPVIVTGDMNSGADRKPHDNLSKLTTKGKLNGKGAFYESDQSDKKYFPPQKKRIVKGSAVCARTVCRSGEPTHWGPGQTTFTHKLDYVYFSAKSVVAAERVGLTVVDNPKSDHAVMHAWADLK